MTRIKFCGMRRLADIELVNRFRPDYVGLVLAPGRRQVSPEQAALLVRALRPGIQPVGVFVNEQPERIAAIVRAAELVAVQLHGDEGAAEWAGLRRLLGPAVAIWQKLALPSDMDEAARRIAAVLELLSLQGQTVSAAAAGRRPPADSVLPDVWLLDTEVNGQSGGTGQTFPWTVATPLVRKATVALAGGLTPANVVSAIRSLHPAIVDCSSGIERNLEKQEDLMDAFCRAVRSLESEESPHEF
jgi:phosphoribosylanthranilate isomerase